MTVKSPFDRYPSFLHSGLFDQTLHAQEYVEASLSFRARLPLRGYAFREP